MSRIYVFPLTLSGRTDIGNEAKSYLDGISSAKWLEFVNSGLESLNRQKRFANFIFLYKIYLLNGALFIII